MSSDHASSIIKSAPGSLEHFNECRAVYLNQPLAVLTSKRPFDLMRALRKARRAREEEKAMFEAASSGEEGTAATPSTVETESVISTSCESAGTAQETDPEAAQAIRIFGDDASKKKTTLKELVEVPTDEQLADDDFEPVVLEKRIPLSMIVAAAAKNWADLPEM